MLHKNLRTTRIYAEVDSEVDARRWAGSCSFPSKRNEASGPDSLEWDSVIGDYTEFRTSP